MITIVFPNELFMEKKFTLMKTLTAFCNLLCGRKNACAVGNDATLVSAGCTTTTVNNESNNMDDPDRSGSFLFYEQSAINDQTAMGDDSSSPNDQKLKDNEGHDSQQKRAKSDELASGNGPASVYDRARWRVNDDLAACSGLIDEWSVVSGRWPGVNSDWQLWNKKVVVGNTETTNTGTKNTMTNKNDAWLPFASFYFLFDLIFKLFKCIQENNLNKNSEPVFIPVRICDKSKMHCSQNRFNKKNQI